jgi:predicted methyltransferase
MSSERDQWQRPDEIVQALNLRRGNVVVDLGSGAGYFALKLSVAVGKQGRVLAVDIRRLPLIFLWIRALLRNQHNVTVAHAQPEQPDLPAGVANGVLVANTYHEFHSPKSMVDQIFRSLAPGGRLVIVDRGPEAPTGKFDESEAHHHVPVTSVEVELRQRGFEIVRREDRFINRSGSDRWWLIVARKPLQNRAIE